MIFLTAKIVNNSCHLTLSVVTIFKGFQNTFQSHTAVSYFLSHTKQSQASCMIDLCETICAEHVIVNISPAGDHVVLSNLALSKLSLQTHARWHVWMLQAILGNCYTQVNLS